MFALLLTLFDPIPKSDEPLAWRYSFENKEITFYTIDGRVYRQFKMPETGGFRGIYDNGKKVLFYGKDGKAAGKDVKSRTCHVRRLGNETTGEDLGVPVGNTSLSNWLFSDDLKTGVESTIDDKNSAITHKKIWNSKDGKIVDCDYPKNFLILDWLKNGQSVYGNLLGQDDTLYRLPFPKGERELLFSSDDESLDLPHFSSDGRFALGRGSDLYEGDQTPLYVFDMKERKKIELVKVYIHSLVYGSFSSDGKHVFYAVRNIGPGGIGNKNWDCFLINVDDKKPIAIDKVATDNMSMFGWLPSKKNFQFFDVNAKK